MKRVLIVLVVVAGIGAGAGAYYLRGGGPQLSVDTAPLSRGDIVSTVASTGTLQAVTTVQVGSQVSGNISYLGADFNSIVKKGQVIARLDPSLLQAQLAQSQANLAQANANRNKAKSDLERMKVLLLDAQQKYDRAKELSARQLETKADLDAAKIAVDSAQASLVSQEATVTQTDAAVAQSQASLSQTQVNLDHTVITAPIDGIVTQRSVDVGQTVAASMQAPTLFIIAADLTKMQVNANIDESDVGNIRPGQRVTFRVDAYPTDEFEGTVTQIRLQPVVQSNVTTYGTIIDVPNNDLKLKPGMTANLNVEVARKNNANRVPNAAIRFRPTTDIFAALNQPVPPEAQFGGRGRGRGGRGAGGNRAAAAGQGAAGAAAPAAGAAGDPPAGQAGGRRGRRGGNADGTAAGGDLAAGGGRADAGGFGGGGQGGRGGGRGQALDRFKAMSPEQQEQFLARMKDRGVDTTPFEAAMAKPAAAAGQSAAAKPVAETIDALFAPLPPVQSAGRVWVYQNKQLKAVNVRLGITDGTFTELLGGSLPPDAEVVTGVTGVGSVRPQLGGQGANNNPLLGNQRGRGPGGFGGGRGR